MSDVLVLCYHAVSERWPADLSVTPASLEEQLHHLLGRGYRGATFHEAVTAPPARRTLAVTFDDGYRSVLELAFPIMQRLGVPGTVFVPSALIGGGRLEWPGIDQWVGGPFEQELEGMTWEELGELRAAGWQIGSHTRTHPRLTRLGDADLARELADSRQECEERLGAPVPSIAYPYGDVDERVAAAAGRAGYTSAAALPDTAHRAKPLLWPRVGVYHGDSMARFRRQVSHPVRRLQATPLWPAARWAWNAVRR